MQNNTERLDFASATNIPNYPDFFLDIQIKSFKDFFQLETKSAERTDEGLLILSWKIFRFRILEINLSLNFLTILSIRLVIQYKNV